jgi:hypothetical protein
MFEVHNINVDADSLTDEQVESFEYWFLRGIESCQNLLDKKIKTINQKFIEIIEKTDCPTVHNLSSEILSLLID